MEKYTQVNDCWFIVWTNISKQECAFSKNITNETFNYLFLNPSFFIQQN